MATVMIWKAEADRGLLPDVCLRCGAPATVVRSRAFEWVPLWVWWFLVVCSAGFLFGVAVWLVAREVFAVRMTVGVPVCDRHNDHWFRRFLLTVGLGVAAVAVPVGGGAAAYGLYTAGVGADAQAAVFLAGLALAVALSVAAALAPLLFVRATRITRDAITLTRVHPDFAARVEAVQARLDEQYEADGFEVVG